MKAKDFIKKHVKKGHQKGARVLSILEDGNWYHIHNNEEIGDLAENEIIVITFGGRESNK